MLIGIEFCQMLYVHLLSDHMVFFFLKSGHFIDRVYTNLAFLGQTLHGHNILPFLYIAGFNVLIYY